MRQLVLLTIEYPDPLISKEIPHLSQKFDKVYLLPTTYNPNDLPALPTNVELVKILKAADLSRVVRLMFIHFGTVMRIYWWTLLFSNDRWLYIRFFKSFVGHLVVELDKISSLRSFVEERKLGDAIFYDYWFVDSTLALAELKRLGTLRFLVSRAHGFDLYRDRQFEGCVPFKDYRLKYLNAVFAISRHGYEHFKAGLRPSVQHKIRLRYLGVQAAEESKPEIHFAEKLIVSCARMVSLKRIELLVEVLREMPIPVRWVHFGDGPVGALVRQKVKTLPSHIVADMKGDCSNQEVLNFYHSVHVDMFVSLSSSEGLPVSMMEAASFGIPIFSTNVNGIPEIVNDSTGRLVSLSATIDEIRSALLQALSQDFNRNDIRSFFKQNFEVGQNSAKFVEDLFEIGNMESGGYRRCSRCILDSNDDPGLRLNEQDICQYCCRYEEEEKIWKPRRSDPATLEAVVRKIKSEGSKKKYDCILGISGGVDSSYLAWQAKKLGLRPLLVHFDNGWNSELAVKNIENIVSRLGFDLHTLVVDWDEFRDLQLAFLKASVIDLEIPTDHAMLATLYKLAIESDIRFILSGHNNATELVLPESWYFNKRDHVHIRAIAARFSPTPLRTFPLLTTRLKLQVQQKGIESVPLLNYMNYQKDDAKRTIMTELGWRDYGGKHYESIFTRFYQGYVLVQKFNVDKRRAHLSNLICSGQITRDEALAEASKPPYDPVVFKEDYQFVLKKLGLSEQQFQELMNAPVKSHSEYPVDRSIYDRFWILNVLRPVWLVYKKLIHARWK